jgi:hypothetical protein
VKTGAGCRDRSEQQEVTESPQCRSVSAMWRAFHGVGLRRSASTGPSSSRASRGAPATTNAQRGRCNKARVSQPACARLMVRMYLYAAGARSRSW